MPVPTVTLDASEGRAQWLASAGGILAAIAASSCCIVPLLLFSLGVSGAWIGNLTGLAPYQPIFVAVTLACPQLWLLAGLARAPHGLRRSRDPARGHCPTELSPSRLIAATLLVLAALAFDYLAPLILT